MLRGQAWLQLGVFRKTDLSLLSLRVGLHPKLLRRLYLVVTSRLLDKPVSAIVKGPSSGGKSYITQRVLDYFPESAYYALSAMSERALA